MAKEGVAALRKEIAGRTESLVEHDLETMPADEELPGGPAGEAPKGAAAPAPPSQPPK